MSNDTLREIPQVEAPSPLRRAAAAWTAAEHIGDRAEFGDAMDALGLDRADVVMATRLITAHRAAAAAPLERTDGPMNELAPPLHRRAVA